MQQTAEKSCQLLLEKRKKRGKVKYRFEIREGYKRRDARTCKGQGKAIRENNW